MNTVTADQIRAHVNRAFVDPARRAGQSHVVVAADDIHADLKLENRFPAVCSALDAQRFARQFRVELSRRSGPRQGSTVKWRFNILP